jgi:hypothetical protein
VFCRWFLLFDSVQVVSFRADDIVVSSKYICCPITYD